MSQENVDRFLENVAAFNRGDVERSLQLYDPDVVLEVRQVELEGEYSGHDGVRRFFAEFAEEVETFEVQYSTFAISETGCWRWGRSARSEERAESSWRVPWRSWRASEMVCAPISRTTASGVRPSKPPVFRSRRCRRRTWRSFGGSTSG